MRAIDRRDAEEIRRRAAEVRRNWSPEERIRRLGLPPDSPWCLRCQRPSPMIANWRLGPGDEREPAPYRRRRVAAVRSASHVRPLFHFVDLERLCR